MAWVSRVNWWLDHSIGVSLVGGTRFWFKYDRKKLDLNLLNTSYIIIWNGFECDGNRLNKIACISKSFKVCQVLALFSKNTMNFCIFVIFISYYYFFLPFTFCAFANSTKFILLLLYYFFLDFRWCFVIWRGCCCYYISHLFSAILHLLMLFLFQKHLFLVSLLKKLFYFIPSISFNKYIHKSAK